MFKSMISAAALIAGVALSSPAAAQTFTPAPGDYVLFGTLVIQSSYASYCDVTIDVSVNAGGAATVTAVDLGSNWGCGAGVYGTTMLATGGLNSVILTIGFGNHLCRGAAYASLTTLTSYAEIDIPLQFVTGNGCTVEGVLYADGPLGIAP